MAVRSEAGTVALSKVARLFEQRPDRVAAAWRRLRYAEGQRDKVPDNLLDNIVESFVHELGATLTGAHGSPWARTRGVLRLSPERGLRVLHDEFSALRRCLCDAADVLGGSPSDRAAIDAAIEEAMDSATALLEQMVDPLAARVTVPFGGVVVEYFERGATSQQGAEPPVTPPATH